MFSSSSDNIFPAPCSAEGPQTQDTANLSVFRSKREPYRSVTPACQVMCEKAVTAHPHHLSWRTVRHHILESGKLELRKNKNTTREISNNLITLVGQTVTFREDKGESWASAAPRSVVCCSKAILSSLMVEFDQNASNKRWQMKTPVTWWDDLAHSMSFLPFHYCFCLRDHFLHNSLRGIFAYC